MLRFWFWVFVISAGFVVLGLTISHNADMVLIGGLGAGVGAVVLAALFSKKMEELRK